MNLATVLALLLLDPSLEMLGPVGGFLVARFGSGGAAALAAWVIGPLALALTVFEARDQV